MKAKFLSIPAFFMLIAAVLIVFTNREDEKKEIPSGNNSIVNNKMLHVKEPLPSSETDPERSHAVQKTTEKFDVAGRWSSLLGTIEIGTLSGKVIGTLESPNSDITMEQGTMVLEGVVIEDCLSGKIRLDAPGCPSEIWGFGVLLLAEDGNVLSGSVHFDSNGCRVQGVTGENGLYWIRVASNEPATETISTPAQRQPKYVLTSKTKTSESLSKDGFKEENDLQESDHGLMARKRGREQVLTGPPPLPGTYDPGNALKRTDQAFLLKKKAQAMLQAGRFEKARNMFEAVLQENPCDPFAINGIGVTYASRNLYDEALVYFKKALSCDPTYMDIYYNMGCVYARKSNPDLAIRYLKIALMNGFAEVKVMREDPDLRPLHGNSNFQALLRGEF